jgi:hypothetical protein
LYERGFLARRRASARSAFDLGTRIFVLSCSDNALLPGAARINRSHARISQGEIADLTVSVAPRGATARSTTRVFSGTAGQMR